MISWSQHITCIKITTTKNNCQKCTEIQITAFLPLFELKN